ncbi:MAG: hypothetical protein AAGF12_03795 [Myxococcota bacterium]
MATSLDRPYPKAWTVRQGLDAYLSENGFSNTSYDDPWMKVSVLWFSIPFPNPPKHAKAIRLHDLHHVATAYGTDLAGEAEISAWELRRGLRGLDLFVSAIVIAGAFSGLFHAPRRTLRAWADSRKWSSDAGTLYECELGTQYDALLDLTIGELRTRLAVPQDGLTEARKLHAGAARANRQGSTTDRPSRLDQPLARP